MLYSFSIIFAFAIGFVSNQVTKSTAQNYDYCDPKLKLCEVAGDHVMCKYPVSGLSDKCTLTKNEPLRLSEKKAILFWHNKFRSAIAVKNERGGKKELPTASNMRQIYWDIELEALAERWAHQCVSSTTTKVYDQCRNTKRFQVSQNVGTRRVNDTIIDKQVAQIVISWFKDSKDFLPAYVDEFPSLGDDKISAKQFANVIWADTYAIGCARVIFQEDLPTGDKSSKKTDTWSVERVICNYGPGGNIVKRSVYKVGPPCQDCPEGTECSRTSPGLCATKNSETSESQQKVENQENKEVKEESNVKSQIPVTGTTKPNILLDNEQSETFPPVESDDIDDEDEKDEMICEGDNCQSKTYGSGDTKQVNEILEKPKIPTARKKLPLTKKPLKTKKAKRVAEAHGPIQDGEKCTCYVTMEGGKSSGPRVVDFVFFGGAFISALLLL